LTTEAELIAFKESYHMHSQFTICALNPCYDGKSDLQRFHSLQNASSNHIALNNT